MVSRLAEHTRHVPLFNILYPGKPTMPLKEHLILLRALMVSVGTARILSMVLGLMILVDELGSLRSTLTCSHFKTDE